MARLAPVKGRSDRLQLYFALFIFTAVLVVCQPVLLGFTPALLTSAIVAYKNIWRSDHKSLRTTFLIGFITSAGYMGAIIVYLGINSLIEIGVLLAFMIGMGLFGAIDSAIAGYIALPKACKSRFDISAKKEEDGYNGLSFTKR